MQNTFRLSALFFAPVAALALLAISAPNPLKPAPPPGTTPVAHFFMDKQEITNLDYREYLSWLGMVFGKESENYRQALPDSGVWRVEPEYSEPLVDLYFEHPAYENYPVVGVSYEQAVQYCTWRTDRVYERDLVKAGVIPSSSACLTNGKPDRDGNVSENKPQTSADYFTAVRYLAGEYRSPQTLNTLPAQSGFPNGYGLYNAVGNAAEMIAEKGVCKGGSYAHLLEDGRITSRMAYDKPASWLGFRCVCVLEMPK